MDAPLIDPTLQASLAPWLARVELALAAGHQQRAVDVIAAYFAELRREPEPITPETPLAMVAALADDLRRVNMLEENGVLTVGDLLAAAWEDLPRASGLPAHRFEILQNAARAALASRECEVSA